MTIEYLARGRTATSIPAEPGTPYFLEKGEGDRAHLFDDLFTIYAGAEQTEGTFNFFTAEGRKGEIIPAHLHPDTYEVFYITQGAVRLFVEDTGGDQHEKLLVPGDFGFVPRNCPHAYRMERDHSLIVGVAAGPSGTFERFFENLGTATDEKELPASTVVPTPERFREVPEQFDVHFMPEHRWTTGA